jgi:hypothetical protein
MRFYLAAILGMVGPAMSAAADDWKPPSPNIKDVEIAVSAPPVVQLTPARRRGDTVASVAVKVTIKNKSPYPIPFGLHYLGDMGLCFWPAPGQPRRLYAIKWWEWPGPNNKTVINIDPGQTYTTTCHYSFVADPGQPRKDDVYYVRLRIYGHQANADITMK